MKKSTQIILGLGAIAIVIGLAAILHSTQPKDSVQNVPTQNNDTATTPTQSHPISDTSGYSQHASDYMYAYISALSDLYKSTQRFTEAQSQMGNTGDTTILLSLSETLSDLKQADSTITPFINDGDEKISVTAKLLHADILAEIAPLTQMQASYTYAANNQDVQALQAFRTQMVAFATAKNSLEDDQIKSFQIIKYVIQNLKDTAPTTGPIDFAISPDNRVVLLNEIDVDFPKLTPDATSGNKYLVFPRVIQILLSSDTYEKLQSSVSQI